jgi:HlyD family secretion protein
MKKKKISGVWAIVGVVVAIAVIAWLLSRGKKDDTVNFTTEAVAPANIENSVTATGSIEAVKTVTVGTQVSGIIDKLYVDYNSVVKKGQVIAELDKQNLLSQLNSSKAALSQAQANLTSAMSDLAYQKANYQRYRTLYNKGLIAANDYEQAHLSWQTAAATVAERRDAVASAREEVNRAQTNLSYAVITSPIDGVVISKSVEEGQTVAASYSTPTLFTIAKDLKDMRVIADVDEADIGGVKVGQRVTFTVDAYPDDTFEGAVTQVRQEATTTNNVVTYEVVISAPNQDLKLKPGLTANVTIYTQETKGVLSVPSKALRFTPEKDAVGGRKIKDIANAKNKVWTLEGNTLVAHRVTVGATDGTHTQILSGIKKGQKVITGYAATQTADDTDDTNSSDNSRSPFAPGPMGNKKK